VIGECLHCARAENSYEHEFLARAEIKFQEFGNRDDDDVNVDGDVVPGGDKPEYGLVDAVVVRGFVVPGCPCGCQVKFSKRT
jgi:hypothetical protein